MAEAAKNHFPGMFYVPMSEIGPNTPGLQVHYKLVIMFDLINRIDRDYLNGMPPVTGMSWGIARIDRGDQ